MSDVTMKRFSPLALLGLAACGGETTSMSGGTTSSGATSSGIALKGPLSGALAFVDSNGDRMYTPGEEKATTGPKGEYSLSNPNGHAIVIQTNSNTIDESSGSPIDGLVLVGSATDSVVSPFTTIKVNNPEVDLVALAKAMGLEGVDLTSFNPYDLGENPDDQLVAKALDYEKTSHQVVSLLTVAGSALAASGGGSEVETLNAVFDALAVKLQEAIANDEVLNLTDETLLGEIVVAAGEAPLPDDQISTIDAAKLAEISASVKEQVAALNTTIGEVDSLEGEVEAFASATALADFYDANAEAAVNADLALLAANDAPTDVILSEDVVVETIEGDSAPVAATKVGDFSALDADLDDTASFTISGDDAVNFEVVGGALYMKAGIAANFEAQSTYTITVTATDSFGASFTKDLEVKVGNLEEAGDAELEINGSLSSGEVLTFSGVLTDPDNAVGGAEDTITEFTLKWSADGVVVATQNSSEPLELELDFGWIGQEISAQVFYTDAAGNEAYFESLSHGIVVEANVAPTDVLLADSSIDEISEGDDAPTARIEIGALSVLDANTSETTTVELTGGADVALFEIEDGVLYFKAGNVINFEAQSSYAIVVTGKDAAGASIAKSLTVDVNNIDEPAVIHYSTEGVPFAGQNLVLIGDATDPDNGTNPLFKEFTVEWFADGTLVQTNTPDGTDSAVSLEITTEMAGKQITAKASYVDQAGFAGEFESHDFGVAMLSSPTLQIDVYESSASAVTAYAEGIENTENFLEAMASLLDTNGGVIFDGIEEFLSNGGEPDVEVSSSGIFVNFGPNYGVDAEFANFNPTSFQELEAAFDSIDPKDLGSINVSGGFDRISFSGPDDAHFSIEFDEGGWGNGAHDVMRLNVPSSVEDAAPLTFGLIGQFDNQISSVLDIVAGLAEIGNEQQVAHDTNQQNLDDKYNEIYALQNASPQTDFSPNFNQAFLDYSEEVTRIEADSSQAFYEFISQSSDDYDLDGFFVVEDHDVIFNANFGRAPQEDGTNVITLSTATVTLAIWGQFPDEAIDMAGLLSYAADNPFSVENYDTTMTDLAEFGFEGIEGFGLYDQDREPLFRVEVQDFEALTTVGVNIDFNGDYENDYVFDDIGKTSYISDDQGTYEIVGNGIDLDALYAFMDDHMGSTAGSELT